MSLTLVVVVFALIARELSSDESISFATYFEKLAPSDIKVASLLGNDEILQITSNVPSRDKRDANFGHMYNMYSPGMVKLLSFTAFGREFKMHLHRDTKIMSNDLVLVKVDETMSSIMERPNDLNFYMGYVIGEPATEKSHVYWEDEFIVATIKTRDETYFVEPARKYNASMTGVMIVYRMSDMKEEVVDSTDFCKTVYAPKLGKKRASSRPKPDPPVRVGRDAGSHQLTCPMAVVSDVNYYTHVGQKNYQHTLRSLIGMFSRINVIFLSTSFRHYTNYSISLRKVMIHTEQTSNAYTYNIFGGEWSAYMLLNEFSKRKLGSFCLAHLLTYSQLDDALGLAFVARSGERGGICSGCITSRRTGVTCYNTGISSMMYNFKMIASPQSDLVVAHELGHGFGSHHDGDKCVPSKIQGGRYLMYSRTNMGKEENNKKFSPCSIESIQYTLATNAVCFVEISSAYCGNGVLDEGEECDSGITIGNSDVCCGVNCKLKPKASCSVANWPCCAENCKASKAGEQCRGGKQSECLEPSYCDGVTFDCEPSKFLKDGSSCSNMGKCRSGHCSSPCVFEGDDDCVCSEEGETCYLCCRSPATDVCSPFRGKVILEDGFACRGGFCTNGTCRSEQALKSIKAWLVNRPQGVNLFKEFVKKNVVIIAIVLTIIPYFIISLCICRRDYLAMLKEDELRAWYSTRNKDLFWKDSTVKVRIVSSVKTYNTQASP